MQGRHGAPYSRDKPRIRLTEGVHPHVHPEEVPHMAEESSLERYSPDRKGLVLKYGSIAASGIIAGGSMISLGACSSRQEQWAETAGKAGQINLEAVEEAMKKSEDVTDFEKRVNEIYQGEEMILIEVKNEGTEQHVSGYADLNNNLQIDYDADDKLFTFRRSGEGDKQRYSMTGYGVNSYYHHPYPYGTNLLTTYLLVSALSRPMYMAPVYQTTVAQRQSARSARASYRQTPSYRNQVSTNRNFQTKMSAKHGTSYRKASPGASRQRWAARKGVNLSKATRTSKGMSRGFSGSKSRGSSWSSRGFGGFRGGGTAGGRGPFAEWSLAKR